MMRTLLLLLVTITATSISAQYELKKLPLKDLSAFEGQAGNWSIVGKVMMNPDVDIHEPPPPPPVMDEKSKKKKRKRKKEVVPPPPPPRPKAVTFKAGTGILLNMNNDLMKDNLLTSWEHGDLRLELDVMIPKGSNSGIYLQGRYEVQLLDSWGVADPAFSDIGGIYRNWENEKGKIYMGKAPITKDIAKRNYTPERIVELIYNPEPANWPGYATPMAPMPQVPRAEALKIAKWINSLR